MSPNRNSLREHRPVFVDASGRRQRRLRVVGAIAVMPAVGYVALLFSTVFGGPTIHSPFLPLPAPPAAVTSQHPKPTPASSTTSSPAQPLVVDVVSTRQFGDPASTTLAVLPIPAVLPTSSPIAGPTRTSARKSAPVTPSLPTQASGRPTSLPTQATAAKGKPTSLPTPPRRPIKP